MRHGFLIDMDGVIYRGREMVPGADRFINHLRETRYSVLIPDKQ